MSAAQNRHLEAMRRRNQLTHERQPERLESRYTLLYGAIAGGAAETTVYPLIVLQRRMQVATMQAAQEAARSGGAAVVRKGGLAAMRSAAVSVYKAQGLAGFYTGYLPNILQVPPSRPNQHHC